MSTTTQAGAGPVSDPITWHASFRCPDCRCRTFARIAERKPGGSFGPGPMIRCVECKRTYHSPDSFAALAPPAVAPEEVRRVMQNAVTQARGALHLDAMVDDAGKPYGTTVVAMEALAEAEALLSTPSGRTDTPPAGGGTDPWAALRRIADLRLSEAGEPFDDALDIADKALDTAAPPYCKIGNEPWHCNWPSCSCGDPTPPAGGGAVPEDILQAARPLADEAGRWDCLRSGTPGLPDRHEVKVPLGQLRALGRALTPSEAQSEAQDAGETLETIAQWCEETFGPITPDRIATRANEEMVELMCEPSKVEEAADVVIVLSRYPGLWDAIERKMKVNRARRWRFMGDGTGYHIKEESPPTTRADTGAEGGR